MLKFAIQRSQGARAPAPRSKRLQPTRSVSTTSPATSLSQEEAYEMVTKILSKIKDSDSGRSLTPDEKREVDAMIELVGSTYGAVQQPRPIDNPLVFGNYNVAYSSPGERQGGEPAGGRFRSKAVSRALFTTTGLFQSILAPTLVVNKVAFRLFGLINASVSLRGALSLVDYIGNRDTVRVKFEPPRLNFGPVSIEIGPKSYVVLSTTYLDERVRLGKGARGSYFVFTRGGESDQAQMDTVGAGKPSILGKVIAASVIGSLFYTGYTSIKAGMATGNVFGLIGGALATVLGLALTYSVYKGGIEDEDDPENDQDLKRLRAKAELEREIAAKNAAANAANN